MDSDENGFKMKIFSFLICLSFATVTFAADSFSSRCDLDVINSNPQEYFQSISHPEGDPFTATTAIAIYGLRKELIYRGEGFSYNLYPAANITERDSFTKRLVNIMMTFPKAFMQKHDSLCFVLVDRISPGGTFGLTQGNVVFLSTIATNTIITHELFHAFDHMYSSESSRNAFSALNPEGARYSNVSNGAPTVATRFHQMTNNFVSPYATSSLLEDRAEVFAGMALDYNLFKEKTSEKPVIRGKIEVIKKFIGDLCASGGTSVMDERYWTSREVDVGDGNYESCLRRNPEEDCQNSKQRFRPYPDWNSP